MHLLKKVRQLDASCMIGPLHGKTSGVILPVVDLGAIPDLMALCRDKCGDARQRPFPARGTPMISDPAGRGLADMSRKWRMAVRLLCVDRDWTPDAARTWNRPDVAGHGH